MEPKFVSYVPSGAPTGGSAWPSTQSSAVEVSGGASISTSYAHPTPNVTSESMARRITMHRLPELQRVEYAHGCFRLAHHLRVRCRMRRCPPFHAPPIGEPSKAERKPVLRLRLPDQRVRFPGQARTPRSRKRPREPLQESSILRRFHRAPITCVLMLAPL